jgi:hypothetical protein
MSIDLRTIPFNLPSLCIPRVFSNIGEQRIKGIFDELNLGEIERIDIVSKQTESGEKFNRVFVHFRSWKTNESAKIARGRLLNGQDIKIVYDDPWFWKISAYRPPVKKESHHPKQNKRPPPRLEFDNFESRITTSSRYIENKNTRSLSNKYRVDRKKIHAVLIESDISKSSDEN